MLNIERREKTEFSFSYKSPRPGGASWCGAHDMVGNVYQWTSDRQLLGGSFRTPLHMLADSVLRDHAADTVPAGTQNDVGFRVALSAAGDTRD